MFALGARLEQTESILYTVLDALVVTGFKMQAMIILVATPVPAIQGIVTTKTDGAGHHLLVFFGNKKHQLITHGLCDLVKKRQCQRRVTPFLFKGDAIKLVHRMQLPFCGFVTVYGDDMNILFLNIAPFTAYFLAFTGIKVDR